VPEMVGYSDYDDYEPLSEPPDYAGYAEPVYGRYGEPDIAGYLRERRRSEYNPGCPAPTNVNGFGESPLEGYTTPRTVNPVVKQFDPQPGPTPNEPETFRPLW